jgi:hypothetical protein
MYMRFPHSIRLLTSFAASTAGLSAVSCSTPDKSPVLETAASAPGRPRAVSTASDTSVKQSPETSITAPAAQGKPAPEPARTPTTIDTQAATTRKTPPAVQPTRPPADSENVPTGRDQSSQDKWVSYDAGTNTVTFELIAGPFTFNGYRNGEGALVVPSKANIVINFVNKDGTPHSAIVIPGEGAIPNSATDPAIPRAYTNKVLEGMPQEATDVMRFPVPESGTYRIFCGVPGHGLSGMWIWLKIDPAAKTPSFGPTKG